jgi:hypothetical protein
MVQQAIRCFESNQTRIPEAQTLLVTVCSTAVVLCGIVVASVLGLGVVKVNIAQHFVCPSNKHAVQALGEKHNPACQRLRN